MLDEIEFDVESEGEGLQASDEEATVKVKAEKRAKQAPLHQDYVAPLSFLIDALNSDNNFNITKTRPLLDPILRPTFVLATKTFFN